MNCIQINKNLKKVMRISFPLLFFLLFFTSLAMTRMTRKMSDQERKEILFPKFLKRKLEFELKCDPKTKKYTAEWHYSEYNLFVEKIIFPVTKKVWGKGIICFKDGTKLDFEGISVP